MWYSFSFQPEEVKFREWEKVQESVWGTALRGQKKSVLEECVMVQVSIAECARV